MTASTSASNTKLWQAGTPGLKLHGRACCYPLMIVRLCLQALLQKRRGSNHVSQNLPIQLVHR